MRNPGINIISFFPFLLSPHPLSHARCKANPVLRGTPRMCPHGGARFSRGWNSPRPGTATCGEAGGEVGAEHDGARHGHRWSCPGPRSAHTVTHDEAEGGAHPHDAARQSLGGAHLDHPLSLLPLLPWVAHRSSCPKCDTPIRLNMG